MEGIKQPELVLVRASAGLRGPDGSRVHALLLLIDDPDEPARLERIERRLSAAVEQPGFPSAWSAADSPRVLRSLLRRHPRTLTFRIEAGTPAADLAGVPLREADLPDGCLVTLVRRDGEASVPDGRTELAVGDQVTMVGEVEALEAIAQRLGLAVRGR